MKIKNLEDLSRYLKDEYNVVLRFIPEVAQDIKAINKGNRTSVLALIVRRAKQGPLFVPEGVAVRLNGNLHQFSKIKSNSLKTRVIYRPIVKGHIYMDTIAVGPRDKEKAYKLAAERLESFHSLMEHKINET